MKQDNSTNPILLAIFDKMVGDPQNAGYHFDSIDDTNVDGETPLHVAASVGDLETGKILLDAGANPNWPDEHHLNTPLHKATSQKNYEFVKLLLSSGASQEIKNREGYNPFDLAKRLNDNRLIAIFSASPISKDKSQRPEVFAALRDASSTADNCGYIFKDVRDTNLLGDTALHVVVRRGDIETAKVLLDLGADPNARGEYGYAPIHEAASGKNYDLAKLLLEYGGSKDIRNDDGLTPADYAKQSGDPRLIELFHPKG
jgi:ankyrin repeat protein